MAAEVLYIHTNEPAPWSQTITNFRSELQLVDSTVSEVTLGTTSLTRSTFLNADGTRKYDTVAFMRVSVTSMSAADLAVLEQAVRERWATNFVFFIDGWDASTSGFWSSMTGMFSRLTGASIGVAASGQGNAERYNMYSNGNFSNIFGASNALRWGGLEAGAFSGVPAANQVMPSTYYSGSEAFYYPTSTTGYSGGCLFGSADSSMFEQRTRSSDGSTINMYTGGSSTAGQLDQNRGKLAPVFNAMSTDPACTLPELRLQKTLSGTGRAATSDQFTLTISGSPLNSSTTATSTTTGSGTAVTSNWSYASGGVGSTYTFTEAMASGSASALTAYTKTYSCVNGRTDAIVAQGAYTGSFTVTTSSSGDDIVCTVNNYYTPPPGTIVIIKDTQPDAPQDFTFTTTGTGLSGISLDDDADATLSNTKTFTDVVPGNYSVTEGITGGWTNTSITCVDPTGNTTTSTSTRTATINVASQETVTCTFVNQPATTITLAKEFLNGINANCGGLFQPACDRATVSVMQGATTLSSVQTANSGATVSTGPVNVTAGTAYSLTDSLNQNDAGYTKSIVCSNATTSSTTVLPSGTDSSSPYSFTVTPQVGDNITCTWRNNKTTATTTDLAISKTAPASVTPGGTVSYTIRVWNNGATAVTGATITDNVPGNLTGVTWTCAPTGTAAYGAASGSGNAINLTANLPVDAATTTGPDTNYVTLTVNGTATGTGSFTNTANVTTPSTIVETTTANNTASATTTIAAAASIKIIKDSVPDNAQDFAFTTTGTGLSNFSLDDDADATLSNEKLFSNLAAGSYTVSETATSGWVTQLTCTGDTGGAATTVSGATATIGLDAGENIVCTYVNTKQAILRVQKTALGGGTTFNFNVTGAATASFALNPPSSGGSITHPTPFLVTPGTNVTVEESATGFPQNFSLNDMVCTDAPGAPSGSTIVTSPAKNTYANRIGGSITGQLVAGADVTCTFTNTKNVLGTITKTTVGGNGTFTYNVYIGQTTPTGTVNATKTVVTSANYGTTSQTFPSSGTGNFTVQEVAQPGWVLTAASCTLTSATGSLTNLQTDLNYAGGGYVSGTVTAGSEVRCDFTNQRVPSITVAKKTTGGTGTFTFSGGTNGLPASLSLNTATANPMASSAYAVTNLNASASITEDAPAGGWTLQGWECATSTGTIVASGTTSTATVPATVLQQGNDLTCTFNNVKPPTITLVKTVINNNGGTATTASFTPRIDGTATTWGTPVTVAIGSHTASETTLAGYAPGPWGGACAADGSITVAAGDALTCTITNDDIPTSLTLNKVVVNDNGGTATSADFTLKAGSTTFVSGVSQNIAASTYALSESGPSGYVAGSWTCTGGTLSGSSLTLAFGQTASCTLINDDAPIADLAITKTNSQDGVSSGSPVTYQVTVTNRGPASVTGAVVKDNVVSGLNLPCGQRRDLLRNRLSRRAADGGRFDQRRHTGKNGRKHDSGILIPMYGAIVGLSWIEPANERRGWRDIGLTALAILALSLDLQKTT